MGKSTAVENLIVKPIILTQSKTLTDSYSGKTIFLNAAGGFTVTLPKPRAGVNFEFIVKTAPTTNYVIASNGASDVISGQIVTNDTNAGFRGSVQTPGVSTVKIMANIAKVGDSLQMISDGTYWYANGYSGIYDAIRFVEDSASPSASPSVSPSLSPSISPSAS